MRQQAPKKYSQLNYQYPSNLGMVGQEPMIIFDIRDSIKEGAIPEAIIGMYMPSTVKVQYSAQYTELVNMWKIATGLEQDFMNDAHRITKEGAGLWETGKQWMTTAGLAPSILSGSAQSQLELNARRLLNPHMTQAFKSMNFRNFQFEFQMMAKNKQESDDINNIIYTFKSMMHPDVKAGTSDTERFLTYPAQFIISLYSPNDRYLFKVKNCALIDMEVDYAGSGIPSFFDETGAPVDIRMNLRFSEMTQLTRQDIAKGA